MRACCSSYMQVFAAVQEPARSSCLLLAQQQRRGLHACLASSQHSNGPEASMLAGCFFTCHCLKLAGCFLVANTVIVIIGIFVIEMGQGRPSGHMLLEFSPTKVGQSRPSAQQRWNC